METKTQDPIKTTNANLPFYFFLSFTVPSIALLILLFQQVTSGSEVFGDKVIGSFVSAITNPFTVFVFTIFTNFVTTEGVIILLVISIGLIWWRSRDYVAMIVLAVGTYLSDEVNQWLKLTIGRERPSIDASVFAEGHSFPSGHAMVGIMFYGFLTYFVFSQLKNSKHKLILVITMSVIIFSIGLSRIILNVHYPSDVIAGFAAGFIGLVIMILLHKVGNTLLQQKLKKG
ncbi:phosphatase PAP2 family protein [Cytobacillus suaedae]|nr:phosphatase PAP2 family protein [Cytobacillus suaedae]